MECGTELEAKHLENEGNIPYCNSCEGYRFPVFNTAVSMVILNKEQNKILLIKQYGGADYILCAGYVNKGEDAEQAAAREIAEELGLQTVGLRYNKSEYFEKNNIKEAHLCHCIDLKSKIKFSEILEIKEVGSGLEIEV